MRLGIVSATVAIGLCFGGGSPSVALGAESISPGLEAILADPDARGEAINDDIRFRKLLHFRAGRSYVEGLYDHPERTTGSAIDRALFTPEESKEFNKRNVLWKDAQVVRDYYDDHPKKRAKFGGLLIDHAAGGVLAVYLLDGAATPWEADLIHPGRLIVRSAKVSEDELEGIRGSIDDAWLAGDAATDGVSSTSIDVVRNMVRVGFTPKALEGLDAGEAPAEFSTKFGTKNIRVVAQSVGTVATNIKGGWSYQHYSGGAKYCTLGLPVNKSDANDPDDDFILAAGHCEKSQWQKIYHHGNLVGRVVKENWPNSAPGPVNPDASLVRVEEDTGFDTSNHVVDAKGGTPYKLEIKDRVTGHAVGESRCITGIVSRTDCGTIGIRDATVQLNDGGTTYTFKHLVRVDGLPRKTTDSGGPAYWQSGANHFVRGAGILTGKNETYDYAYYSKIARIESIGGWNVSLKKNTNATGCHIPGHGGPGANCPVDQSGDY